MKVLNSFPIPEEPPIVPQRLADRITDLLPRTVKIDVTLAAAGGWQIINTLTIEGDEDPVDVYSMVKLCGDHHASMTGESAKYRAQIWLDHPGRDGTRCYVSFDVRLAYDEEDAGRSSLEEERMMIRSQWREVFDAQQELLKLSARFTEFSIERVVAMSKQQGEHLNPLTDVIHELITPYRDGLQMQARAVKEMGDMRVRQQLAEAKADESGKFWEMFGPAVQIAATQASSRLLGGGGKKAAPASSPSSRAPRTAPRAAVVRAPAPPQHAPARAVTPQVQAQPKPAPAPVEATPVSEREEPVPTTLHDLAHRLLDGMSSDALVKITRTLDDDQADWFQGIADAEDEDSAAESIVALMHSLMKTPAVLVRMQQLLGDDHIRAFQHVAVLAKRHLDERDAVAEASEVEAVPSGEGHSEAPSADAQPKPVAAAAAKPTNGSTGTAPRAAAVSTDDAADDAEPGVGLDAPECDASPPDA